MKKSKAAKAQRASVREEKKAARQAKRDARQSAREEKQDARGDAREERQRARQDSRTARRDAKQEKKDAIRAIRDADDLDKSEKRERRKEARQEKRDAVGIAKQDRRDATKQARTERKRRVQSAQPVLRVPKTANEVYQPKSLAHLQAICRVASDCDLKVHAIGADDVTAIVGQTDDLFVETQHLNKTLPFGPRQRRRRLKPAHQGGADTDQSLAELEVGRTDLLTNGHRDGPLPSTVKSFVLVGNGGRTYRIEPRDGITNPDGWSEPGIDELIQDDAVFASAGGSLGRVRIVYSAIVEED